MVAKIFLTIVGVMYLALAIWCSVDPATTSQKVGFDLHPGSGQSEFVTIYGGLEFGMAMIFVMPWAWRQSTRFALTSCLLIHLGLVIFRSYAFFRFDGIGEFTYRLAIAEWVILLASATILLALKDTTTPKPPQNS